MSISSDYTLTIENPETGKREDLPYTHPSDAVRYARMVKEIRPYYNITLTGPEGEIDWLNPATDWEQE